MKKFIFLLLFSISMFSQGILTPVDRLKIKKPKSQPTATQLVTRDVSTQETGVILKTDFADLIKSSPTFTGIPSAPTATLGTTSTQLATTAFVTQNTAIKAINEGSGIGYVISNRNPLNYGNVGLNAVDLSTSDSASNAYGAIGNNSTASGNNSTASGYGSTASGIASTASGYGSTASGIASKASGIASTASGNNSTASGFYSTASGSNSTASGIASIASGYYSTASGFYSTASGNNSTASGNNSFASGIALRSKSYSEYALGIYNTDYTPLSTTAFNSLDRVFGVGNGFDVSNRSDALIILKNGLTTLPSVTNALITAEPRGKAVVTKEWAEERFKTTAISSSTYFQNITLVPTVIEGMTITPPLSGTYKVDFNGQFNTTLANITQQSVVDLNILYLNVNSQIVTNVSFPTFSAGSTIYSGIYETAGAIGPVGVITLDAQGNPNAKFIFKTIAALTVGAGCTFNLINGATSNNIFFIASGAISLGANSNVSGTFISPLAAVGVGSGAYLDGRVFSLNSAITNMGNIVVPTLASPYQMGIISNFAIFTSAGAVVNVGSNIIVGDTGTNNGTITGFETATLSGYIYLPAQGASNCKFSIYVNGTEVTTSTRERTNAITKDDVILSDTVTTTAGQAISIKILNSIGISRFYNRNLTVTKI